MNKLIEVQYITTTTYQVANEWAKGFNVDIVDDADSFNAFLYHVDYGIKSLMFGAPKLDNTIEGFIDMVNANLNDYIHGYINEYMD